MTDVSAGLVAPPNPITAVPVPSPPKLYLAVIIFFAIDQDAPLNSSVEFEFELA